MKNYEEFVTKKPIERDKEEFMNCLCIKKGILRLWVHCWLKLELQKEENTLSDAREISDPQKASSSGATHVPDQTSTMLSPRTLPRCDSGLARVTQNCMGTTGNVFERLPALEGRTTLYLLRQSKNLDSSSHELRPDIPWKTKRLERKMRREPQNSSIPAPRFQRKWETLITLVELILTLVRWIIREFPSRNCIWENISKLESQDWGLLKIHRSSCHNALDQRSWDSKVNWRIYDIAIPCGAKRFHRLRYAWCDDWVCIEETARQAYSLPQKSKGRRAACSKIWPILTWEANCLHDLWAFSCNWSLWSCAMSIRPDQYALTVGRESQMEEFQRWNESWRSGE